MDTSSIFGFIVALYASLTTCAVPPSDLPAQQQEQTAIVAEQETQEPAEPEVQPIYDPVATPKQPTINAANVGYNDKKSWWFRRNADHLPPSAQDEIAIGNYDAYYLGDTQHKVIYLTFVKAAFFVTKSYMEDQPELVKRMVAEGHIVGNHSVSHPNMSDLSNEQILAELNGCAAYYKELTGQEMPKYFRPPEGVYSIRSLEQTKAAGYKTIFWSFAYNDWDPANQPGTQAAYDMVMNNYHNGSIMLLHAVSQSNTEALDQILKDLKAKGYVFQTLDQLPPATSIGQ